MKATTTLKFLRKKFSLHPRTPAYRYSPLLDPGTDIRLLTLLPREAAKSNGLQILIHHVKLDADSQPDYEALSYTWGSTENPVTIHVGRRRRHLQVTRNLADALMHLQHETENRVLWVDAICIDQDNLNERNRQVNRMGDIYRMAPRATVWLGPGDEKSILAMRLLNHLSTKITVDWMHRTMDASQDAKNTEDEAWADITIPLPYSDEEGGAILSYLGRPWFGRLWIRQEIWLTASRAILACGNDVMRWVEFRKTILCLFTKAYSYHTIQDEWRKVLDSTWNLCDNDNYNSLVDLLASVRSAKCLDPRDRVYGILNLIHPNDAIDVQPDYEKSTFEVYEDLVLRCINQKSELKILRCCHLDDRDMCMPSWIPNLAERNSHRCFYLSTANASAWTACNAEKLNEKTLKVTGRSVVDVREVQWVHFETSSNLDIISVIRKLVPFDLGGTYAYGGSIFDAFCRTISQDQFSDGYWPRSHALIDFEQFKAAVRNFLDASYSILDISASEARCLDLIHNILEERQFITTNQGGLGLAPRAAQAGDQVCVLLGMDSLALLRLHPASTNRYEVVGEAFIYGLMNGEFLLGPLPKPHQAVLYESDEDYLHGFLNQETEQILDSRDDPRLGKSWKEYEDHGNKNGFMDWENEWLKKGKDPRRTARGLRERGVKLEDFYLV